MCRIHEKGVCIMRFSVKDKEAINKSAILVIPVYQDKIKDALQYLVKYGYKKTMHIEKLVSDHKFTGEEGTSLYLTSVKVPVDTILFYGLGKLNECSIEKVRMGIGKIIKALNRFKYKDASLMLDSLLQKDDLAEDTVAAVAEAVHLAMYTFTKYKKDGGKKNSLNHMTIISHMVLSHTQIKKNLERGKFIADAINGIRDLGLEPSNQLTPQSFADSIKKRAKELSLDCDILSRSKIEALRMGGVLGVSQGSKQDPRFVVVKYRSKGSKKHICLVGKGVTFDSGGISLKPSKGMDQMKYDMLGAATVAYTTFAAAQMNIPVDITAIMPLVENMPGGGAMRPGDIISAMSGTTIEVLNTDAEGRLILADALAYAQKMKPDYCFDFATLTGAVAVALGSQAMAVMGTDQPLIDQLCTIGEQLKDRCWQLPLWKEYADDLKSDVADVANIGSSGEAGTIVAGMFLSKFIEGIPWVHFDIAATAWSKKEVGYAVKGPTGAGVRVVLKWLASVK